MSDNGNNNSANNNFIEAGILKQINYPTGGSVYFEYELNQFDNYILPDLSNINNTISFTFVLGSSLAGAAGILYGINYPSIDPLMGLLPGIKAFVAAVLGGIGNFTGAVIGGLLIGIIETLTVGYISPTFRDAITFSILILILLFRPSGLFGKYEAEKV